MRSVRLCSASFGAGGGARTHKSLRTADFKSAAFASFATPARICSARRTRIRAGQFPARTVAHGHCRLVDMHEATVPHNVSDHVRIRFEKPAFCLRNGALS